MRKILLLIQILLIGVYSCSPCSHLRDIPLLNDHLGDRFTLTDTLKNAIVLQKYFEQCDSLIYALPFCIKSSSNDTIFIYQICACNIFNIGDTVTIIPYTSRPPYDALYVLPSGDSPLPIFLKGSYNYSYGTLHKSEKSIQCNPVNIDSILKNRNIRIKDTAYSIDFNSCGFDVSKSVYCQIKPKWIKYQRADSMITRVDLQIGIKRWYYIPVKRYLHKHNILY
jgi:hypothetical protein